MVLLCHGITSEKEEGGVFTTFAGAVDRAGCDTLRFDFRGHGESPISGGRSSITGMMLDLHAALSFCASEYESVHIVAASFGASVLLLLLNRSDAADYKIGRVALWNPVTDYASSFYQATTPWAPSFFPQGPLNSAIDASPVSFGADSLTVGPEFVVQIYTLNPSATIWPNSVPLLMLHGQKDTLINYRDTMRYAVERAPLAETHLYPESDHGLDDVMVDVQERTLAFLTLR